MYLWASKDLYDPAHTCSLIHASAFLTVFYIVRRASMGVFYCVCLCFLVFNQTDMREIKE